MKIAQFISHFADALGGLEVCVHNIALRHQAMGADVTLYCRNPERVAFAVPYRMRRCLRLVKVRQTYPVSMWLARAFVAREQRRHGYDVWQVNAGYPYGAFLGGYFEKSGVPGVLRCSGDDIQVSESLGYGVARNPKIARIIDGNYGRFDALVAISDTVRLAYLRLGVPASRIRLIPNGVDAARIAAVPADPDVRARHGIPAGALTLLTVGRNHPKKNYASIPGLLAALLDRGCDAWWLVVGGGSAAIDRSALPEGRRDRLVTVETVAPGRDAGELPSRELVEYYKAADVFVMTSLLETFGIVLLEAMAAGLPVAAFDAPGVRDVAGPDVAAVCPAGDNAAMVGAILEAARKRGDDAAREARLAYARAHSWDRVAADYLALYEELARTARTTRNGADA
ncbi:glycosyltransferase family 4 protein [Solidesulfovibrio alcoholivorans]|uniref:glycosyltransferase family 4 protein n=1 Tax=Solidesulfovibrio alcoholivorans TaxID=81406 RepID=UPI00049569FD|nr:glycosyltransferase family 4 protein [Solidesulfovibrio alcoholivorans]